MPTRLPSSGDVQSKKGGTALLFVELVALPRLRATSVPDKVP